MSEHDTQIDQFLEELRRQDKPDTTIKAYQFDLLGFASYFAETAGEPFSAEAITPTDIREYPGKPASLKSPAPASSDRQGWPMQVRQSRP